jgi:hypothetical protein
MEMLRIVKSLIVKKDISKRQSSESFMSHSYSQVRDDMVIRNTIFVYEEDLKQRRVVERVA